MIRVTKFCSRDKSGKQHRRDETNSQMSVEEEVEIVELARWKTGRERETKPVSELTTETLVLTRRPKPSSLLLPMIGVSENFFVVFFFFYLLSSFVTHTCPPGLGTAILFYVHICRAGQSYQRIVCDSFMNKCRCELRSASFHFVSLCVSGQVSWSEAYT